MKVDCADIPSKGLKSIQFIVILLLLSIIQPIQISGQSFQFDGDKNKGVINFIKIKNLIVIPVTINGQGPYNFLLDTGVGQLIITDTTFLRFLSAKVFQTYKIQGYGMGREIKALFSKELTARVGNAEIKNIPSAIFKEDIFDLSSYLGMKIHGILGYYFFGSFIVKINYAANKITYYAPDSKPKLKGVRLPLTINNFKPYVKAEIVIDTLKTDTLSLLVDNGSSHALLLESIDNNPFPLPKYTIPANLGVGINGAISGVMGRIHSLKMEQFTFNQLLAGFPLFNSKRNNLDGASRNGNLGAELLKNFLVTFDYPHHAMYLKKRNSIRKKIEHDMSGIELYTVLQPFKRVFISRIEAGSPGNEVGLTEGDEILTVDLKPTENYSLDELTEMFRERDGKQMIIEVMRNNVRHFVVLKLKRRI